MSVMRPRPPASQGLRAANTARDKDVEQVRRLLSTQPKPAAAAAGGGILGVTEAVGAYHYLGGGTLNFNGWTFTPNPYGGPGVGPSLSASGDSFAVGEAGYYSFRWKQTFRFTTTGTQPTSAQAELNSSRLSGIPDPFWTVILTDNHYTVGTGQHVCVIDKSMGPFWCEAGELWTPRLGWIGAGDPTALGNYGVHIYVTRHG